MRTVAVLFARADSIYKSLPSCDVYDIDRDARTWPGGAPIVAHPPCRAWGSLAQFSKPRDDERALAPWAIEQIRRHGGVLEHPARSRLWPELGLPEPGQRDKFGGWTLVAPQMWWSHPAEKKTRFYIVGIEPADLPVIPFIMGEPLMVVAPSRTAAGKAAAKGRHLPKSQREVTPPLLAAWLVELARRTSVPALQVAA